MELHPNDSSIIEYVSEDYNKYPDTVKQYLSNEVLTYMSSLMIEVETCESPIEYLLGIAMNSIFPRSIGSSFEDYLINPQEKIECGKDQYRVDFFIVIKNESKHHGFVVECDGHNFHEKTKEQAKKDKKRDRNLTAKGYPVIRFTGSEILENPNKCAREVVGIIQTFLKG